MILTGHEISREIENNNIEIDPFEEANLNPNSYNLHLSDVLRVYGTRSVLDNFEPVLLDCKKENSSVKFRIPDEGIILKPNKLYLGVTKERTSSRMYVPLLDGRSSLARLGLFVHITGGFGDIGFNGQWTLELACIEPIRIYANMAVCQIRFELPVGRIDTHYDELEKSKYSGFKEPVASKYYKEFLES